MNTCFYDWAVAKYAGKDSPSGDLAADMARDPRFPRSNDRGEIKDYLLERGACDGAMDAFASAWKYFKKSAGCDAAKEVH